MKRSIVRRGAVGFTLVALAATGLAGVPAPAHAAITNSQVYTATGFGDGDPDCPETVSAPDPAPLVLQDNGVPVSTAHAVSGQSVLNGVPADKTIMTATSTITATATPIGAGPATISATASVSAQALPALGAATQCSGYANGEVQARGEFTLAAPTWVTITANGNGSGSSSGDVWAWSDQGGIEVYSGARSAGSATALLPAGTVYFGVRVTSEADADEGGPAFWKAAYTGTFKIELFPLGHPSVVSGKGAGHVVLGARSCSTGAIDAAITKKAQKKAKQVLIKVNGAKIAKFKGKKLKKRSLVLPAAPSSAAEVVATITLKNGKKVTVTRSYLACS